MLMLGKDLDNDLKNMILMMESLFRKRYHIKDLTISNVALFLRARFSASPLIDLQLTSIYSRQYHE